MIVMETMQRNQVIPIGTLEDRESPKTQIKKDDTTIDLAAVTLS